MIMQIINIASGVVGASSSIKNVVTHTGVQSALDKTRPHEVWIGIVTVILGLLALVERLGFFYFDLSLGSSFPQAIPAILLGLVLGAPYFEKFTFLKSIIATLMPYRQWLGFLAIACGLGSLLFGCVLLIVCTAPFGI